MKKLFAFISILAVASAAMFADLSVKKNADGSYEATFFYGNPRATEVLLAGTFTDWQNGALPMEKGEKGFSLTKTFPASTEKVIYKFISDGNWTTDLKAPEFVDDGFGGKNSQGVLAELAGGDDNAAAGKAKINFISWSMIGTQAKFLTQGASDATSKGFDLDSVTFGMKSYDKFAGMFLPNCPLYIEVALAETELDDAYKSNSPIYLLQKGSDNSDAVEIEDGLKDFFTGLLTSPVATVSKTNDNSADNDGPGSNPFLGHLKFGFNTPYVNFLTGFNYAKPDVRQAIKWATTDSHWDAGYQHVGGFNVFSLGEKSVAALEEATGLTWDVGFAPNKTGDRKGTKFGYWAWAGVKKDALAIDFQSNGMYDGDYLFEDPVEHDFILGAKDTIALDSGKVNFALEGLVATHQKSSADLSGKCADYFGYSTDVFYRTTDFDGIQNIAANAEVGYESDLFSVDVEYRMRGAQASMLYVRENHDDGTFDLSEMLGVLNSQRVALNGTVNATESVAINLGVTAEMALETLKSTDALVTGYYAEDAWTSWYKTRCGSDMAPLFGIEGGAELVFDPSVDLKLSDNISLNVAATMKYSAYDFEGDDDDEANEYSASDSAFLFKKAGVTANIVTDSDVLKGVDLFYGLDNSNDVRMFNTLIAKFNFDKKVTAVAGIGLKTVKSTDAADSYDEDTNNPFAFVLGCSKKLTALKEPTVYAQFVYNMDAFKNFGDGQDNLALDGANVTGRWDKSASVGDIDAVDFYDGAAAVRVGIRWDI